MKSLDDVTAHMLNIHVLEEMNRFNAGGAREREEMLEILKNLKPEILASQCHSSIEAKTPPEVSLWDQLGGAEIIEPMCNDLYDLHASDPLTKEWFGAAHPWNERTAAEVKKCVYTFFSAGIGGPFDYACRDMAQAHASIREQKPLSETAFYSLSLHVMKMMKEHGAGGAEQRETVLGILYSLKDMVMGESRRQFDMSDSRSLWDRMGGERKIREMSAAIHRSHSTDPLTKSCYLLRERSEEMDEAAIENIVRLISAQAGGPYRQSPELKLTDSLDEVTAHMLNIHVLEEMYRFTAGGAREREEMLEILKKVKPEVIATQCKTASEIKEMKTEL